MPSDPSDFEREWRRHYGATEPLSYVLRMQFPGNWVRFHSLPSSKRYPQNEGEWTILLARQAALAAETLGHGAMCWRVEAGPVNTGHAAKTDMLMPKATEVYQFRDPEGVYGAEGLEWRVSAALASWDIGTAVPRLRRIADDEGPRTLWMACHDGSVFAPYDGGVDLFFADRVRLERIASEHAGWLPVHPDGL
jgi:hypothetical protein